MKWELWKDKIGRQAYIISHWRADSVRNGLSDGAKVIWSCDVDSEYEAREKYSAYQGYKFFWLRAWLQFSKNELRKLKRTYKELGWEE